MTRSELIRKISRFAGVPESETRVFFEIFLKRLPMILKNGQALFLNQFGYFYLLQGKIKNQREVDDSANKDIIDLVYFTTELIRQEKIFDGLFFNVPVSDEDEFNAVDASFSLSFGKPLIPFKGNVEPGFYIPHTGLELRRLIESKVDKTIDYSEITEINELLTEALDIDSELFNLSKTQSATGQNFSIGEETELSPDTEEENTENIELKKYGWDLDKNLSKEIEEDSIIDLAETSELTDTEEKQQRLSWDFDSFEEIDSDLNKVSDTVQPEDDQPELLEKDIVDIEYDKEETEDRISDQEITAEQEQLEKFERVKTISGSIDFHSDEEAEISKPELSLDDVSSQIGSEEESNIEEKETEFIEFKSITKSAEMRKKKESGGKSVNQPEEIEKSSFKPELAEDKYEFRHRHRSSSVVPYIMLVISVCIIGYGIYYYITSVKGISDKTVKENTAVFNTDNMDIVERDFDFPVSYPYPKRIENPDIISDIFNLKENDTIVTGQSETQAADLQEEQPVSVQEENTIVSDQPPPGEIKKLGVNLFQYGNVYIVQVAAFRSNSVAQTEAERFRNKGHNAFVERAEIDGTLWHRVKVGNFTELNEAQKFAVQFK